MKGNGYKLGIKVKKDICFYIGNLANEESYYYKVILVNNIKLISINYCYYIFIKFLISKITYIVLFLIILRILHCNWQNINFRL